MTRIVRTLAVLALWHGCLAFIYVDPNPRPIIYPPGYDRLAVEMAISRRSPDGPLVWTLSGLREGDIMDDYSNARNVIRDTNKLWINNTVPFAFAPGYSNEQMVEIIKGMKLIMKGSCIKFRSVKIGVDKDYIYIQPLSGCWSLVGRQGTGAQTVSLMPPTNGSTCVYYGVAAHEFLHALGFEHMHDNFNRDDYVTVNFTNVQPKYYHDFDKISKKDYTDFGIPYDYDSVMHYDRYAFSVDPDDATKTTIIPKDPNAVIGQNDHVSKRDFKKLNIRYNCTDFL
ncbi:zinc metalloproteinase nas-14-like [Cloeon dipterum]|uniref:zinc metalloproteinase nas-14-like n=1 Tax=Cloeon dipterum TaxID=197152 RepID=UPI003220A17A